MTTNKAKEYVKRCHAVSQKIEEQRAALKRARTCITRLQNKKKKIEEDRDTIGEIPCVMSFDESADIDEQTRERIKVAASVWWRARNDAYPRKEPYTHLRVRLSKGKVRRYIAQIDRRYADGSPAIQFTVDPDTFLLYAGMGKKEVGVCDDTGAYIWDYLGNLVPYEKSLRSHPHARLCQWPDTPSENVIFAED